MRLRDLMEARPLSVYEQGKVDDYVIDLLNPIKEAIEKVGLHLYDNFYFTPLTARPWGQSTVHLKMQLDTAKRFDEDEEGLIMKRIDNLLQRIEAIEETEISLRKPYASTGGQSQFFPAQIKLVLSPDYPNNWVLDTAVNQQYYSSKSGRGELNEGRGLAASSDPSDPTDVSKEIAAALLKVFDALDMKKIDEIYDLDWDGTKAGRHVSTFHLDVQVSPNSVESGDKEGLVLAHRRIANRLQALPFVEHVKTQAIDLPEDGYEVTVRAALKPGYWFDFAVIKKAIYNHMDPQ